MMNEGKSSSPVKLEFLEFLRPALRGDLASCRHPHRSVLVMSAQQLDDSRHFVPWEVLKRDTLRLVCRDLGVTHLASRREEMCQILQEVDDKGCE